MMFTILLTTAALALPPDATPKLMPIGTGVMEGMALSFDGDVVVGRDQGSKAGWLLFVEDWSWQTFAPCENVLSVAYMQYDPPDDGYGEVWAGCQDGRVFAYQFEPLDQSLTLMSTVDGNQEMVDIGQTVDGLWWSGTNGLFYAVTNRESSGPPDLHAIDPGLSDGVPVLDPASTPYPVTMATAWSNFQEGVLLDDDNTLIVHHAQDNMSIVTLSTATTIGTDVSGGAGLAIEDIFQSWSGGVYGVTGTGILAEFFPAGGIGGAWSTIFLGLNKPNGVAASLDPTDPWIAVTGGDVRVWQLDPDTGSVIGTADQPWFLGGTDNSENYIQDGVVSDGYLFGGGTAGNLHISTSRPWVEPSLIDISPTAATAGDVVTISFTLDEAGDWEVRRGGDRLGGGVLLESGSVSGPESLQVELTVDQDWDEGDNSVYVFLEGDEDNQTGHARTTLFVDNPPDPPNLSKQNLGFGDKLLILQFDGIDDADLDHYLVYVTVTPFEPEDYPGTDGPAFDGDSRLNAPLTITAAPSEAVDTLIKPLKNDVKHYVAVRAVDQGGLVGPMSQVISEIPRPAFSASELAGETGGPRCATTPGTASWWTLGLAAFALLRRRAVGALAVCLLALAAPALAQDDEGGLERDMTKQSGDFELRYGGMALTDPILNDVYRDNASNILQVEFGPQFFRVFELDFGIGFFQELAFKVDANGNQSGERTMLTWWPAMSFDGSFRLHIFDEQLIVPYVRAGYDWVIWSEKSDSGGGKDIIRGDKFGSHVGGGASLLLDIFDKKRASLLEAQTGINDSYLTFEWRRQRIDQRPTPWAPAPKKVRGLDLGGTMFTVGIKLDY